MLKKTISAKNHQRYYYQIPLNVAILTASVFLTLLIQRHENSIGGGIARPFLFVIINIEIFIAILLIASIIKQSIILFLERRQKTPGSVFKKNLLFAFIFLAILPGTFIFLGASKLIIKHLDLWFGARIDQGISSGLEIYQAATRQAREKLTSLGAAVTPEFIEKLKLNKDYKVSTSYEYAWWPVSPKGINLKKEPTIWRSIRPFNDRNISSLKKLFVSSLEKISLEKSVILDFFGSTYWVKRYPDGMLAIIYRPPENLQIPLIRIQNAQTDYHSIRAIKHLLRFNFYLQAILLLALVLILAVWGAFYLARGISTPLQKLLSATNAIGSGNLTTQVALQGSGDLQDLAESFNKMTQALAEAQATLARKNKQLVEIFEHLSVGILLISPSGIVTSFNQAANKLITAFTNNPLIIHKRLPALPLQCKKQVTAALKDFSSDTKKSSHEINFNHLGQHWSLKVHLHKLEEQIFSENFFKAYLVIIENLSDVLKLNTFKTWQEAVKQIAHEIKNPLTPIQLTAQRLHKKIAESISDDTEAKALQNSCLTILSQVTTIKNLVADFSYFAAQKQPILKPNNLCKIIAEACLPFQISYPTIKFVLPLNKQMVNLSLDEEKIKRVFSNLITNSIHAFHLQKNINPIISITVDQEQNNVSILYQDNGPGIAHNVIEKLFLPYVSTSKKNMGLGLAIVHETITLHNGSVGAFNTHEGAAFIIKLPIRFNETNNL